MIDLEEEMKLTSIVSLSNIFIISSIISIVLWIITNNNAVAVFTLILSLGLTTSISLKKLKNKRIYFFILAFQIIFMITVYYSEIHAYGVPYMNGGTDDMLYETQAIDIEKLDIYTISEAKERVLGIHHNSPGYPVILSFVVKIMNSIGKYHTIMPRLINIFLFIITLMIIEKIALLALDFNKKKTNMLIGILGFFPAIAYINSHIFRDTLVMFFVMLFIYKLFKFSKSKFKFINILICIICILFISELRDAMIPYLILIAILVCIRKTRNVIIAIVTSFTLILLLKPDIMNSVINSYVNYYELYNDIILESNSGGLSSIIFTIPLFPFGAIARVLYGIVTPFPNVQSCIRMLVSFSLIDFIQFLIAIGTMVQIYLFSFILNRKTKINKIFVIFIIFYSAYVFGTFTFRHMLMFYPFMFMIIAERLSENTNRTNFRHITIVTLIIFLGVSGYLFIK